MSLLTVEDLRTSFPLPRQRGTRLQAVDGIGFSLDAGESLALVGESGCGKTTTALLVARLLDPEGGRIRLDGETISDTPARRAAAAPWRRRVQMVFQDPAGSLDPRLTAEAAVAAPLVRLTGLGGGALRTAALEALARVRLEPALAGRRPHELSGGQLARVGIARAIALRPALLILDEATASLDVSTQAAILRLLEDLRRELGLAFLFISHDLGVVRRLCRRVLVMHRGRIVESGETERVFTAPAAPYTQQLLAAIPRPPQR